MNAAADRALQDVGMLDRLTRPDEVVVPYVSPQDREWAAVNAAADQALQGVAGLNVQSRDLATPMKLAAVTPGSSRDSPIVPSISRPPAGFGGGNRAYATYASDPQPQLPPGWYEYFDEESEMPFYSNPRGEVMWEHPGMDRADDWSDDGEDDNEDVASVLARMQGITVDDLPPLPPSRRLTPIAERRVAFTPATGSRMRESQSPLRRSDERVPDFSLVRARVDALEDEQETSGRRRNVTRGRGSLPMQPIF